MDTIKKKMLAMKNEKDAATDRAEQLEQSLRDTETAKSEVEEERDNLQKKIMQMECDLDQVQEGLQEATTSLEEAEKSKTQAYSSDEEEEMLIVVLDDDDDLVIGKSKDNQSMNATASFSTNKSNPRIAPHSNGVRQSSTNHNRTSPARSSKHRDSKSRTWGQQSPDSNREYRQHQPQQQHHHNTRSQHHHQHQRPMINTQLLAQRLNNIRQDEFRQSSRGNSPRRERTTPTNSSPSSLSGSMHSSYTESMHNSQTFTERPHAVIAKPVERRKKRRKVRPDPEGASLEPMEMDELEKLISNDEPIFSDYGSDEENETKLNTPNRQQNRTGPSIAAFSIGLGLTSNTMIKYTIIATELQNIIRVSLKMYEEEIQGLNRRLQLCEEKLENTEERLTSASSKLEEASQAADESER